MADIEKKTRCPFCDAQHELVTALTGEAGPADGDATMCFACGEWALFDRHWKGGLRKPTHDEYAEFVADPVFVLARQAWLMTMAKEKRR